MTPDPLDGGTRARRLQVVRERGVASNVAREAHQLARRLDRFQPLDPTEQLGQLAIRLALAVRLDEQLAQTPALPRHPYVVAVGGRRRRDDLGVEAPQDLTELVERLLRDARPVDAVVEALEALDVLVDYRVLAEKA